MKLRRSHFISSMLLALCPLSAGAYEISPLLNIYGNLNLGLEYRMVDDINNQDLGYEDHFEIQDAYSGIGVRGEHKIDPEYTLFYDYALALDITNGKLAENPQTSWEGPDVEENVAKVGVKGRFGELSIGRMWNAYYNRVAYTTDHFSSGWTGFDTFAPFQLNRMIAYKSPDFAGLTFAVNIKIEDSKREKAEQDRYIAAATYVVDNTTINVGIDTLAQKGELIGVSVAQGIGALTVSGKLERMNDALNGDSGDLLTLLFEWVSGKNTFKFHVASGDYPDYLKLDDNEGSEFALGVDHRINSSLYLFVEYHHSNDYCAYDLTEENGNGAYTNGIAAISCQVMSVGSHYAF